MNLNIDKKIFNEAYLPYLMSYTNRKECYYGSAGSGKSVFVGQKLVLKALSSKRKVLVIRKIGATQRDSCFQLIKDVLQSFKIYEQCKINKTDLTITLPTGSIFLFKGLDDPEKIKSIAGITDIWVEEATELTLDDVTQLDLRLRAKDENLQILFSFNPTSKQNWVYTYFGFATHTTPENCTVLKTTYKDNKFLPEAYVNNLLSMKDTNPTYYKIYVEGDFATLDKLVFPRYEERAFEWKEKLYNKDHTTYLALGCDFGYQDPTAMICSVVDETEKVLYIFDEHYERAMLNPDIARMIIKKGFQKEKIFCDCAEPKSIQELRRQGISRAMPCKKGKDSIHHGIQKVLQYKIVVHPSCTHTLEELQNYSYKKDKTGEYTNEPLDNGYCHLMDALRYSLQIVRKKAKMIDIKL